MERISSVRPWLLAMLLIVAACGGGDDVAQSEAPTTGDATAVEDGSDADGPHPAPEPEAQPEPEPEPEPVDPSNDGIITLTLDDWSIVSSHPASEVGNLGFTVDNVARGTTHEVIVVETNLPPDGLPLDPTGNVDEESTEITILAELRDLGYDTSTPWARTLAPGGYVVLCNLPAHYRRGMWAELEILPTG